VILILRLTNLTVATNGTTTLHEIILRIELENYNYDDL